MTRTMKAAAEGVDPQVIVIVRAQHVTEGEAERRWKGQQRGRGRGGTHEVVLKDMVPCLAVLQP